MNTWQASIRLCKQYPTRYWANSISWGLFHLSWMLPGLVTMWIFDELSSGATVGWNVWSLAGLLAALGVVRFGHLLTSLAIYVNFRHLLAGATRLNMMRAVLGRPGASALPNSAGEAVSRFRGDNHELNQFAGDRLVDAWGLILMPIIGIGVMWSIEPRITMAVVIPLLAVLALVNVMRGKLEQYRESKRKAAGRVTGFIGEMYGSVQAIKVANAEESVGARLAELNERRRVASLKDTLISELLHTLFMGTVDISTGIILLMAGQVMSDGSFTIGEFALFVAYLWEVNEGLTFTGNMLAMSKQTQVSLNRMGALVQGVRSQICG